MSTEKFTKLISIQVDDKSLTSLETSLKEINQEIEEIKKNEVSLTATLEEQAKTTEKLNQLDAKRNEILTQQEKIKDAGLTATEQQAKADKKAYDEKSKLEQVAHENSERAIKNSEALFKSAEAIGGGFQIALGASTLFGEKTTEQLEKAQTQILSLISATDGIKKISEGRKEFSALTDSIKQSSVAAKFFGTTTRAAITATGIGVLVIALGLVIQNFDTIKETVKDFIKSTPFGPLLEGIDDFIERIGGLDGILTIAKESFKGLLEDAKNLLTLNWSAVGDGIKKGFKTGEVLAEQEKIRKDTIKNLEEIIKKDQQALDIMKANGVEALQSEQNLIIKRKELQELKLKGEKAGSEESKKIQEELNKEIVALDANRYAIQTKNFNDYFKNAKTEITKQRSDNLISEEEYQKKLLDLQDLQLVKQLELVKEKGNDTADLELQLAEFRLNRLKQDQVNANAILDKELEAREIALEESYRQNFIEQDKFEKESEQLQRTYLVKKLNNEVEGSKAYLDLRKQIADIDLKNQKDAEEKFLAQQIYYNDRAIQEEAKILDNQNQAVGKRLNALDNIKEKELENNKLILDSQKKGSLEYQKTLDDRGKIEVDYQAKRLQVIKEGVQQVQAVSDMAFQSINALNEVVNQIGQNQIDEANKNIENFQSNTEILSEQLSEIDAQRQESADRQKEAEDRLKDARGQNFEAFKQQIENERVVQAERQKQADYIVKKQIENEKKIQEEKDKATKLQKQQAERQKAIQLAQAVINTALGITSALTTIPLVPLGLATAIAVGITGTAQVAAIASQKIMRDGGVVYGPSHEQGGIKGTGAFADHEIEGGEYIVNRRSTAKYLPLLEKINSEGKTGKGRKNFHADGAVLTNPGALANLNPGQTVMVTNNDQPVYVSVKEIREVGKQVEVIESRSKF